jgi:hypothetical protein
MSWAAATIPSANYSLSGSATLLLDRVQRLPLPAPAAATVLGPCGVGAPPAVD